MHVAAERRAGSALASPRAVALVAIAAFAVAVVVTAFLVWPHQAAVTHAHLVPPVIVTGSR